MKSYILFITINEKQCFLGYSLPSKILSDLFIELDHPGFTSLDFAAIVLFTKQDRQPCARPTPT
jgi:hypothetical protein